MKPPGPTAVAIGTLFPLEAGGAPRDQSNLWPQPWEQGRPALEGIARPPEDRGRL
jgi:hypothetical protein